jgi:hypothetical protein
LIIGAAALLLIGGGVLFFLMYNRDSSPTTNTSTSNTTVTTTASPSRSPGTTAGTYPTPSTTTTTTTTGSYSEDDKHKLFQAVGITKDNALIIEVAQKIGIVDSSGNPNSKFQPFLTDHIEWAKNNIAFISQYRDPAKAREYVMANK